MGHWTYCGCSGGCELTSQRWRYRTLPFDLTPEPGIIGFADRMTEQAEDIALTTIV